MKRVSWVQRDQHVPGGATCAQGGQLRPQEDNLCPERVLAPVEGAMCPQKTT